MPNRGIVLRVTTPERPRSSVSRWLAQAGFVASALVVFICGWLGMKTGDWRLMIVYAAIAFAAAAVATAFTRRR